MMADMQETVPEGWNDEDGVVTSPGRNDRFGCFRHVIGQLIPFPAALMDFFFGTFWNDLKIYYLGVGRLVSYFGLNNTPNLQCIASYFWEARI